MSENWWIALAGFAFVFICGLIGLVFKQATAWPKALEKLQVAIDANNDDAEARCKHATDGVGGRVDSTNVEVNSLYSAVNAQNQRLSSLEAKVAEMPTNRDVSALQQSMSAINNSLGRFEGRIEGMAAQMTQVNDTLTSVLRSGK